MDCQLITLTFISMQSLAWTWPTCQACQLTPPTDPAAQQTLRATMQKSPQTAPPHRCTCTRTRASPSTRRLPLRPAARSRATSGVAACAAHAPPPQRLPWNCRRRSCLRRRKREGRAGGRWSAAAAARRSCGRDWAGRSRADASCCGCLGSSYERARRLGWPSPGCQPETHVVDHKEPAKYI